MDNELNELEYLESLNREYAEQSANDDALHYGENF